MPDCLRTRLLLLHALITACLALQMSGLAQTPASPSSPVLVVDGNVGTVLSLTPADLRSLPRTRVEVQENGRALVYDGVLVGEILRRAGVPLGRELRGDAVAAYVVASAADGYRVVFSIGELDPALTHNDIIIADTIDGRPLQEYQGPLRIVAPNDLRGVRSIRMLTRLQVVRLKSE